MFEDVAVIHPAPGAIVGIPRDPDRRFRANIDDILQRSEGRLLAVDLENLEEESVQDVARFREPSPQRSNAVTGFPHADANRNRATG
jgi:hypothetical protein